MSIPRVLWFDRDIDGRWVVWAVGPVETIRTDSGREVPNAGALIIRDPTVRAFIERLAELVAKLHRFADEPSFGS